MNWFTFITQNVNSNTCYLLACGNKWNGVPLSRQNWSNQLCDGYCLKYAGILSTPITLQLFAIVYLYSNIFSFHILSISALSTKNYVTYNFIIVQESCWTTTFVCSSLLSLWSISNARKLACSCSRQKSGWLVQHCHRSMYHKE